MTAPILLFLLLGACFGVLTATRRHLFSEGVTAQAEEDVREERRQRALWVLLCTVLWPLMLLTGLHSWWLMARRRARARQRPRDQG
ncbi:MAG: hypothetical protein JNJ71_04955 [Rubrivivax sp.]|nr:hypothetical protein [Rubrivivax sp.]